MEKLYVSELVSYRSRKGLHRVEINTNSTKPRSCSSPSFSSGGKSLQIKCSFARSSNKLFLYCLLNLALQCSAVTSKAAERHALTCADPLETVPCRATTLCCEIVLLRNSPQLPPSASIPIDDCTTHHTHVNQGLGGILSK